MQQENLASFSKTCVEFWLRHELNLIFLQVNKNVQLKKKKRKKRPIERDDFPAPPFPYARRRHWSEPLRSSSSEDEEEEQPVEAVESSSEEEEKPDPKLDQTEGELKKISRGMASVFLADLEAERIRRKKEKSTKFIDPRSASRTPAANREPHFRLR